MENNTEMKFGEALEMVKNGKGMRLPTWDKDVNVRLSIIRKWENSLDLEYLAEQVYCAQVLTPKKRNPDIGMPPYTSYDKLTEARKEFIRLGVIAVLDNLYTTMTHNFLYVDSRFGRVPWNPTQIELLSNDWQVID